MEAEEATSAKYSIICCFQLKEFVGQKSLSKDESEIVSAESVIEMLDSIWSRALKLIKREVIVSGEEFAWNELVVPERDEFAKFITFQDRTARKLYSVDQINSTLLSRLRNKYVNIMVHVYGRQLCNKSVHGQFVLKLLQPEQRDRANADNTQSLMALVEVLKQKHSAVFAANVSVWQMWANSIQSAPAHLQEEMTNKVPPAHLIHMFVRASTAESEIRESVQRGLQVADNIIDTYAGHIAMLRKDFDKIRQDMNRGMDFMEIRLCAFEEVVDSNRRLVNAMSSSVTPQPSAVSIQEELMITDMDDIDHN